MKTNYKMRKALRQLDRFFGEVGNRVDNLIDSVEQSRTFDRVVSTAEGVATDVTRFTRRVINKITE